MNQSIEPSTTLAELVTAHPDLAGELERRSLDYCCGGTRTLEAACAAVGLDPEIVAGELAGVSSAPPAPWANLGPAALVDHVVATHHAYLHAEMPRIVELAAKVRSVHGANHGELADVESTFLELRDEFDPHLEKEERVLFPMIRQLVTTDPPPFEAGNLQNPISQMVREHDQAGELLERLRDLTGGYAVPADGCASYSALYRALAELEADTHLHVHIENNRLFPMVLAFEPADASASGAGLP